MADTIAAIATAPGTGAIGILRLSGPAAVDMAGRLFRPADGRPLEAHRPHTLVYGALLGPGGEVIDRALATFSRAPRSYTGEDTAEFQCHGSPMVLQLGLEAVFAQGARQAGPGEFTRRAFLNGRLDLAQAEAVADLIEAETPAAVYQAAGQLSGALSRRVGAIYNGLTDLLAHFHAVLDYPDEDIDPFRADTIRSGLAAARRGLSDLLATYDRGRYIAGGVPCALVGRPNAGKSSLLNALAGYDRAIVTDIPGTTRDTVEERVELGGVTLRLIDTAGLRSSDDPIERMGVERSRAAMEEAELIFVVLDQSRPADGEDAALVRRAAELAPTVVLLNKKDLPCRLERTGDLDAAAALPICAKTGEGLDELAEQVARIFPRPEGQRMGELLTNQRQAEAARRARESVRRAQTALEAGVTPDALLTDVEEALEALGELTGQSVREDIVDRIFQRFCVGK